MTIRRRLMAMFIDDEPLVLYAGVLHEINVPFETDDLRTIVILSVDVVPGQPAVCNRGLSMMSVDAVIGTIA